MRFTRRFQLVVAVAVILALVASGVSLFLRPTTPSAYSLVEQTTLSVLRGKVEYLPSGESNWRGAKGGEVLQVGDRVRTGPDSHGLVTFFEGTTTELEPETEVEIRRLEKPETVGKVGLGLKQILGVTWNRVTKMADVQSSMEIETPTAVAMVRGTEFEVTVTQDQRTEVVTSEGSVDLASEGQTVPVAAGFLSVVEPGKPPTPPVPAPPPRRALTISLHRAGRLFVTDSRGRSLGFFPETGTYVNQIPGAWYSGSRSEPQVIALPDPTERYRVVISPGTARQPGATASRGALVAGWYSMGGDVSTGPAPEWVALPAAQEGQEAYSGQFRVELGIFLAEKLISGQSAEGELGPLEDISFDATVEGDQLKGDIVLARHALDQLAALMSVPQVISRLQLESPDPLVVAQNVQQLIENVARAVMATPPQQYQTMVGQGTPADQEAQRLRLEQVLREVATEAARYAETERPEDLRTNPGLQAIATMASLLVAPTMQPESTAVAATLAAMTPGTAQPTPRATEAATPLATIVPTPVPTNPLATAVPTPAPTAPLATSAPTPVATEATAAAPTAPPPTLEVPTAVPPTAGATQIEITPELPTAVSTAPEATAILPVDTAQPTSEIPAPTTGVSVAEPTTGATGGQDTGGGGESEENPTATLVPTVVPTSTPTGTPVPVTLSGRVLYGSTPGAGVSGLGVRAEAVASDGSLVQSHATTGAEGRYSLVLPVPLPSANWKVGVEAWGYVWPTPTVVAVAAAPVSNVDFLLEEGMLLEGTVGGAAAPTAGATSVPLPNAEVVAEMISPYYGLGARQLFGPPGPPPLRVARARTGPGGGYQLRLPPGYWRVRADSYHYLESLEQWLFLEPGVSVPPTFFDLEYGDTRIAGKVIDGQTGRGVQGAHVFADLSYYYSGSPGARGVAGPRALEVHTQQTPHGSTASASTASDGSYELWVTAETWEVRAEMAEHVATVEQTVNLLGSPSPPGPVDFYLEQALHSVSGSVYDPSLGMSGIAGVRLRAQKPGTTADGQAVEYEAFAFTDGLGAYSLPLSPGSWTLKAEDPYPYPLNSYSPPSCSIEILDSGVDSLEQDFRRETSLWGTPTVTALPVTPSATATALPTSTETATMVPTETATAPSTETATATLTETATALPTETATPVPTESPTSTPTETVPAIPLETATLTPEPAPTLATDTPTATPSVVEVPVPTVTDVPTPDATATDQPTEVPSPIATETSLPTIVLPPLPSPTTDTSGTFPPLSSPTTDTSGTFPPLSSPTTDPLPSPPPGSYPFTY